MHQKLSAEKAELEEVMSKGSSYIKDMEDKVRKVDNEKKEIDRQVSVFIIHICRVKSGEISI